MAAPSSRQLNRSALRRREPGALAELLVRQLMAYRCSVVYAPSRTRLTGFLRDEVLPRLERAIDPRLVVVERWPSPGPTVARLVAELHAQLELEGDVDATPQRRLQAAIERAERRSDRPLLLVLCGLERLLDDACPADEVQAFVDALAGLAALPVHGLQLLLGVQEEYLGEFRELLRGRWRLLANDVRVFPEGSPWVLPVGAAAAAAMTGGAKALVISSVLSAILGAGVAIAQGVGARDVGAALERCEAALADAEARVCPVNATPFPPPAPLAASPPEDAPRPADATDGDDASEPLAETTAATDAQDGGDDDATDDAKADATDDAEADAPPSPVNVCAATPGDSGCARCVRAQCCAQLRACQQRRWRACVLKDRVGAGACRPEAIERSCRALALCALEYQCRAACFEP
ncbi:MAG: hypothetical protein R3A51_11330 [Nannocystaceae bacterium]